MLKTIHLISGTCLLVLLSSAILFAEKNQHRIVVAGEDRAITSLISAIAARAPYFHFFDNHGNLQQTLRNPFAEAGGGAGSKTAAFLVEKNADLIVAGKFGKKMRDALKADNIEFIERQGVVVDAIQELYNAQ